MRNTAGFRLLAGSLLAILAAAAASTPATASHRRPRVSVYVHGGAFWGCPYWGCFGPSYSPYSYPPPDYALVDTDVEPEDARVILDGESIGTADDFDGFPDYLTLSPGRHTLEFRHPGHRTLRINVSAQRGHVYSIDRTLRQKDGDDSVEHEELVPEKRLLDRKDRGPDPLFDDLDRGDGPRARETDETEGADHSEESAPRDEEDSREAPPPPRAGGVRSDSAMLVLRVRPRDASVYIDGRLMGAGDALGGSQGIEVEPGRHTLQVVRPDHAPYRTTIILKEGEKRTLAVRLEPDREGEPL